MDITTINQEWELIEFLFKETAKQLEAKKQDRNRWQKMLMINEIVRQNFPNCLEKYLEQMPPPPPKEPDYTDIMP